MKQQQNQRNSASNHNRLSSGNGYDTVKSDMNNLSNSNRNMPKSSFIQQLPVQNLKTATNSSLGDTNGLIIGLGMTGNYENQPPSLLGKTGNNYNTISVDRIQGPSQQNGGGFFTNKNYPLSTTTQGAFQNITNYTSAQNNFQHQHQDSTQLSPSQPSIQNQFMKTAGAFHPKNLSNQYYIHDNPTSYSNSCRKLQYDQGNSTSVNSVPNQNFNAMSQNQNTGLNTQLQVQFLEETLSSNSEWINIQPVVRSTFKHMYDLFQSQSQFINDLQDQVNTQSSQITDVNETLIDKADIQDVSKAVTEVVQSNVGQKEDIEEIKKQLSLKMNRQECITSLKSHQSMIDEIRKQEISNIRQLMKEQNDEYENIRTKIEEGKRDHNKKLAQIYREIEKLNMAQERKVNIEEFNERLEIKADKQMIINGLINKLNKSEAEQIINHRVSDISKEVERLHLILDNKVDMEVQAINEVLNKKSNIEDINYYRKEVSFKLDKSELDVFRQEFVDRFTTLDMKLSEKNQLMNQFRDALEAKLEQQLNSLKQKIGQKLDQKTEIQDLHQLKTEVRGSIEKMNEMLGQIRNDQHTKIEGLREKITKNCIELHEKYDRLQSQNDSQYQEFGKIKDQLKFLVKERSEDVQQISDLMKNSQKKVMIDLQKIKSDVEASIIQYKEDFQQSQINFKEDIDQRLQNEINDKVRVDEVQDALRRLTESFQIKLENIHNELIRQIQTKNEDCYAGLDSLKRDINDVQSQSQRGRVSQEQLDAILNQLEFMNKDIINKCDKKNVQTQLDFLNENLASLNKEMLMKANIHDIMSMLDKKPNSDEIQLDIGYLKNTLQKSLKDFKSSMEQQNQVNEALCSENCVARWIWKQGNLDNSFGLVNAIKWDLQSVNTCPDNFLWKTGGSQNSLQIEAPGLYEITLAFFSKKKKPLIQVLANGEVIIQSVSKTVCNACGTNCPVQANGHVQKLCNGKLYKISLIEFVALPAKAQISVVFNQISKNGDINTGSNTLNVSAEGFIGLRKL
eukprot:403355827